MTVDAFEDVAGLQKHCIVKIRVVRLGSPSEARSRLAVVVQRRSGDVLAFNRFYQRVAAHICEKLDADTSSQLQPPQIETPLSGVIQEPLLTPPSLVPLLTMVSCTEPIVLAEGLSALASIVGSDAVNAEDVCNQLANTEPFRTYGIASYIE